MPQHDGVLDNAPGATFRADANAALAALLGLSSGATAPSTTYAYMWWADTANTLLKQRNGANSSWITVGTLDATNLGLLALTGGTLTGALTMSGKPVNLAKGASVASASSCDIWTPADGNLVHITGTTTIAGFATAPQAGAFRMCIADAAFTLTHGANLVCPGAANVALAAGDLFMVFADTTTKHLVFGPFFAGGAPTAFLKDDAVTLAKMAHGTQGGLIVYGTDGAPTDLGAGTAGQVPVSGGAGANIAWGAATGKLVARTVNSKATLVTCTGSIPVDNTIPQNSEGTEFITISHTPASATNKLRISVVVPFSATTSGTQKVLALFRDSVANALAAVVGAFDAQGGPMVLEYEMVAGGTSAITFKARLGLTSGTAYVNGDTSGNVLFGGVSACVILVEEFTP